MPLSQMKSSTSIYAIAAALLLAACYLYKQYERTLWKDPYTPVQNYLLDATTAENSKKPILWIHVPYEYNSRFWRNFGSRSSTDLNQPYLYLTVRSILKHCEQSFTICIYDDDSFANLLGDSWNVDMSRLADPILHNFRLLGQMRLLAKYGGIQCPVSFLCMRDLKELYEKGTRGGSLFVCETPCRMGQSSANVAQAMSPNVAFCGAPRDCRAAADLCNYIQEVASRDFTAESKFKDVFGAWCQRRAEQGAGSGAGIRIIDGVDIGTKTETGKPILLDDLMANNYINLYNLTYGIYIPAGELLQREPQYGWFTRMSPEQIAGSNTIIGNYLLLSSAPSLNDGPAAILEPMKSDFIQKKYVGFWRVPSGAPVWGLQPNNLGDNLNMSQHPQRV